jgi:hypothetical protein
MAGELTLCDLASQLPIVDGTGGLICQFRLAKIVISGTLVEQDHKCL